MLRNLQIIMDKQQIEFRHLNEIEYGKAWDYQEGLLKTNLTAKADAFLNDKGASAGAATKNYLLFCRHPHVYTLGKSGHLENFLLNDERLKNLGASFYHTNRGGDITYHGPGQIVGYPILDLEHFFTDLGKYMRGLEEVIIKTIGYYGIEGDRLPGATGVWIEPDSQQARKICAMGVRCSRWITMHGFALNVNTDLNYFNYIIPCGIADKSVTSMQKELGKSVDEAEVERLLRKNFAEIFNADIKEEIIEQKISETVYL